MFCSFFVVFLTDLSEQQEFRADGAIAAVSFNLKSTACQTAALFSPSGSRRVLLQARGTENRPESTAAGTRPAGSGAALVAAEPQVLRVVLEAWGEGGEQLWFCCASAESGR